MEKEKHLTEEEKKEAKREAQKRYDEKRKTKRIEYDKQYRQEHKEKIADYHKQYYQEHKEKFKEYSEKWKERNPEKVKEINRLANNRYEEKYPEIRKQQKNNANRRYYYTKKGRAHHLLSTYRREDKDRSRGECTLTADWIVENIFSGQVCHYCGESDWKKLGCDRIDNSKPHTPDNVVVCCAECNTKKSTTEYNDFMRLIKKVG